MASPAPRPVRVNGKCLVLIDGQWFKGSVYGPKERRVKGRRVEYVWPVRLQGVGYTQRFTASIVTGA